MNLSAAEDHKFEGHRGVLVVRVLVLQRRANRKTNRQGQDVRGVGERQLMLYGLQRRVFAGAPGFAGPAALP